MAKKRGNGEGTIIKRPNGRWMAQITLTRDPLSGKSKRLTHYGKTRQEAAEWLTRTLRDISAGIYNQATNLTVEEWIPRWLNTYARPKVRISTFESYESTIRNHILPSIGHIKLPELRPEHLQMLYNQKLTEKRADGKANLSPRSVGYIHAVLHQALRQAVKEQLVLRNVAEAVNKPRVKRHEITPLTREQFKQLLYASAASPIYPALLLEWATGLRRGELLGLRWQDVDFTRLCISVRQSLIRTRQGLVVSEPKTAKSRRTIPIPQLVLNEIKKHQVKQLEAKTVAATAYQDKNLVFANALGNPLDPRAFTRHFDRLLKEAGLPQVRFHDLRHSHATLLLELGEHPKVVQERLGHSTIAMTLDTYSHVMPGLQEEVANKLNNLMETNSQPDNENNIITPLN